MTDKTPTEKMEALVVPQIHLKTVQNSGCFYVKGREMRGAVFLATSRIPLMINMSICKTEQELLA